jgi:hypothetical protein
MGPIEMRGKYLPDYLCALLKGVWSGFGITDTAVVVLIVVAFLLGWFTGTTFQEHPPGWLITLLASALVAFEVLRSAYQLYATERDQRERLELRLVPQLSPQAPNLAQSTRQAGPSLVRAMYVRVPIKNTSEGTASRCSARLIKIEHQSADGSWRQLAYNDVLDMAWANKPAGTREVDLGPNGVDLLDLVYAIERSRELHLATIVIPHYPNLMGLAGHYRFTIHLTSEKAATRTITVRIHWGFDIDTLNFPGDPIQILD